MKCAATATLATVVVVGDAGGGRCRVVIHVVLTEELGWREFCSTG